MNHNHNFHTSLSLSQISHMLSLSLSPARSLYLDLSLNLPDDDQWSVKCFSSELWLWRLLLLLLSPSFSLSSSLSDSLQLPPAKRALALIFNMSADRTATTTKKTPPRPLGQCWWLLFLWQTCRHLSTNLYKNRFVYRWPLFTPSHSLFFFFTFFLPNLFNWMFIPAIHRESRIVRQIHTYVCILYVQYIKEHRRKVYLSVWAPRSPKLQVLGIPNLINNFLNIKRR